MRKYIELKDKNKRNEICKVAGITPAMLSYALHFQRHSHAAVASRVMAMKGGGTLYVEKEDWDEQFIK